MTHTQPIFFNASLLFNGCNSFVAFTNFFTGAGFVHAYWRNAQSFALLMKRSPKPKSA
ncbi:MAG: hypothetical protein AMXMBFR60_07490 [Chloroflexota bacterium]|nr:hypothetical protein [Anaerolineales bacterium]